MKFEDLNLPENPYRGYYVNKDGGAASIDNLDLISQVGERLFVGGCIDGVDLGGFFSHVFSLYMWEKYAVGENTQVHTVKMYDSASEPVDVDNVEMFSDMIVDALAGGGNVLVHCQAGINRSNLVTARVLMKMGFTADEAIGILREKRSPLVLANPLFERWLRSL